MNKNILSVLLSAFLLSCSANPQNTIPVANSPKPISSVNPENPIKSLATSSPVPTTTPSPEIPYKKVSVMYIYSDDNYEVAKYDSEDDPEKSGKWKYQYNIEKNNSASFIVKGKYSPEQTTKTFSKENFKINYNYSDENIDCYWSSSDPSIISIGLDGKINALKEGVATIKIIAKSDRKATKSIVVHVYDSLVRTFETEGCNKTESYIIDKHQKNYSDYTTISGIIYDPNYKPVNGALLSLFSKDSDWRLDRFITEANGKFIIEKVPLWEHIIITVKKSGYTTRYIDEVPVSGYGPDYNIYDFIGIYSIQDAPEIDCVMINSKEIMGAVSEDSFVNNHPLMPKYKDLSEINNSDKYKTKTTDINSKGIVLTLDFDEPVIREDIENYFRVVSNIPESGKDIVIDKNNSDISFTWASDDKSVMIKLPDLPTKNSTDDKLQLRYSVEFSQPFRDKDGHKSLPERYFRFTPTQINDYFVFSVKNNTSQDNEFKLTDIIAKNNLADSSTVNDSIEIKFNELIASSSIDLSEKNIVTVDTNNDGNNLTVIGYKNNYGAIIPIYSIGLVKTDNQGNLKLSGLNGIIKNIRVKNNSILLDLSNTSFEKNDNLILSIGKTISGYYSINGESFNADTKSDFAPFEKVIDVFGNELINDKDKNIITVQ